MAEQLIIVTSESSDVVVPAGQVAITADAYLDGGRYTDPDAHVINLCRDVSYSSKGYYVSLLADARGQQEILDLIDLPEPLHVLMVGTFSTNATVVRVGQCGVHDDEVVGVEQHDHLRQHVEQDQLGRAGGHRQRHLDGGLHVRHVREHGDEAANRLLEAGLPGRPPGLHERVRGVREVAVAAPVPHTRHGMAEGG